MSLAFQSHRERADFAHHPGEGNHARDRIAQVLLHSLALANESDVGSERARVQEDAVVQVTDVRADHLTVSGDESRLAKIGRDAVILRKVIERTTGQNRQLGLRLGYQPCCRGDRAIAARDKNPLCPLPNGLLETLLQLFGLDRLELEPSRTDRFPGGLGVSARCVEESLERGGGGRSGCHDGKGKESGKADAGNY